MSNTFISHDLFSAVALLGLTLVLIIAYSIRFISKGRAQYARVDKQGGSALLSKSLMEMAYWGMQPVARALVFLHISPNMISFASLGFAMLAGTCLAFGHFGFGGGFAMVSGFLDSLDGMVARLTGVSSDAGEVLDATIDRYAEMFFIGGLVVYYRDIPALQVLSLMALAGSFMVSYSSAKAEALNVNPPSGSMRRPERAVYLTLGAVLSPITISLFEMSRTTPIAIGHPMVMALGLIAVLANASAVERMYAIAKEMRVRERAAELAAREAAVADEHSATPAEQPAKTR